MHRLAEHCVGDVVGGEGEVLDAQAHLARWRRVRVESFDARLRQVIAAYEKAPAFIEHLSSPTQTGPARRD
jgi:hypothetical protein